jgi:hypothetical protein
VNIGMTIGIMPITGLPLPFVSYGGSAIFADMIAVGLLQSVRRHHTPPPLAHLSDNPRQIPFSRGNPDTSPVIEEVLRDDHPMPLSPFHQPSHGTRWPQPPQAPAPARVLPAASSPRLVHVGRWRATTCTEIS